MRTIVYTAEIDDRFGAGKVSSRIGLSSPAKLFNHDSNLFEEIRAENAREPVNCVLVDECQFLTESQIDQLRALVNDYNIPVMCFGLRTDFQTRLFPGSRKMSGAEDASDRACCQGRQSSFQAPSHSKPSPRPAPRKGAEAPP